MEDKKLFSWGGLVVFLVVGVIVVSTISFYAAGKSDAAAQWGGGIGGLAGAIFGGFGPPKNWSMFK